MNAPHLLVHLLGEGIHLQVVDGRLRAEFPPGTRTPGRAEVIRTVARTIRRRRKNGQHVLEPSGFEPGTPIGTWSGSVRI